VERVWDKGRVGDGTFRGKRRWRRRAPFFRRVAEMPVDNIGDLGGGLISVEQSAEHAAPFDAHAEREKTRSAFNHLLTLPAFRGRSRAFLPGKMPNNLRVVVGCGKCAVCTQYISVRAQKVTTG
jgi:hypothetical protein